MKGRIAIHPLILFSETPPAINTLTIMYSQGESAAAARQEHTHPRKQR